MSRKLLLLVGLQGSGKSTFARELIDNSSTWKRVNRDEIRSMVDNSHWSQSKEKHIRQCELLLAEYFFHQGFNLLVDDINLSSSAQSMWQEFAKKTGMTLEVKDFTHVSVEECVKRDLKRPNSVGEKVIRETYRKYLYMPPVPPIYNPALPDALMCDLDGSLALLNGRNPYDASLCEQDLLNAPVDDILTRYSDCTILLVSGRSEEHRPQTERWLITHKVSYGYLFMRATGDSRKDAIIKRELYKQHIQNKWNIRFVLDDRNQCVRLWREELGLPTFQVAYGDF